MNIYALSINIYALCIESMNIYALCIESMNIYALCIEAASCGTRDGPTLERGRGTEPPY